MRKFFNEFCEHSSIHGVRYFTESRRHWSERFWWIVAFGLSFWLCGSSIRTIWIKWNENPVTISFTETEEPVSMIPFPTVTICPHTKFHSNKLNFSGIYFSSGVDSLNLSQTELGRFEALLHVCSEHFNTIKRFRNKYINESFYSIIEDIAPSLDQTFVRCEMQNTRQLCSTIFSSVYTDVGFCFIFNALNSNEMFTEEMTSELKTVNNNPNVSHWSLENGYEKGKLKKSYPIRVFNAKQGGALNVVLQMFIENIEYLCTGPIQGFKVMLTAPGEIRKVSARYFQVVTSEKVEILIKPKMIITSEKLRSYKPNQRGCFFNYERQLRFYRIYTQNNCEAECLANFTTQECGCVKFSMPRDKTTKICGTGNIQCYRDTEKKLFGEDVIDDLKNDVIKEFREECNCLPACTTIKYEAEIDRTRFNYAEILESLGYSATDLSTVQRTILSISFSDSQVTTLQRSVLYTYTDFFAICGGLLGLFLGVSVLSIIEFIYYSTLRLYWTIRHSRSDNAITPFESTVITIDQGLHSNKFLLQNYDNILTKTAQLRLKPKSNQANLSLPFFYHR